MVDACDHTPPADIEGFEGNRGRCGVGLAKTRVLIWATILFGVVRIQGGAE